MSRYTRRTQSRLGEYERQKFGGLGYPQFEGFGYIPYISPTVGISAIQDADKSGLYGEKPSEVLSDLRKESQRQQGNDSGTNWGAIGGVFASIIGGLAPIAGGIYMQGQKADQQMDLMKMAQQYALGQSGPQQPTVIMQGGGGGSKTGLYIGLGVAALAAVITVIVLISR